ncbi:hypothetical protein [Streptococcus lutetiensis]|uniref:hypothetical protein n=1 Tax=Streptococcus lutetiensis TaxID=150055 RepID=UPI0018A8BDB0|nr:hypothetical protein [Streptococcus lutetiensis]
MSKLIATSQVTLMNLTERAEIRKETYYKLTNSRDIPEAPANAHRNFAQVSSGGWSKAYTSFYGTTNNCPQLGKVLTAGMQDGDTVKVRIVLKYDNIVPANGQTAKIWMQGSGNVTDWGYGTFPNTSGVKTLNGSGEIVFESTDTINSGHLKNAYWNWAFRTDYVASGSIQWKEGKVEIGKSFTPYTPAPEQLGWSTVAPVPTPTQRYLWKFEYIYYSDGSVENTQPVNISIAGADGTNGQTSHVHFAFADNATGGGFSLTTPKAYMGWYADFNETASTDPTKYRWSKWKGDQGLPGKPGADGKTSYFHMAYADSADGRTGFSFKESGQQYQGYYTDFTQSSSTDPTKYTWMDRRAGVEVSGRNLWIQSKAAGGFVEETLPDNHVTGQKKCYRITNNNELAFNIEPDFSSRLYRKVTFSAWVKYENVVQGTNNWNVFNCFKHSLYLKNSSTGATSTANYLTLGGFVGTSDWKYITYTYDYAAIKSYDQLKSTIRFNIEWAKSGTAWVTGVMVQFGNVATGHVWAPEDIQADIDSKADQTLTQEQLNALEAKRLQMETEMKALATLQQVSELETFINNLRKEDLDGRQKIIEIAKAIEERVKDIEPIMEYSQKLQFMDTYITQGNGGMVIGANDSTTKVVVTPDRISFQSGGSEVAYISQRMLHIDNGVFTMSLQLGHYITRAHPKNEYVNATYFVK